MKKIIAISVMFVLLTGAAFAVDLGGTVFGRINVLEGDTGKNAAGDSNPVRAGGNMDRIRIDGAGEAGDGAYGGYIRYQGGDVSVDSAYAWWKPVDGFKLIIGSNSDGFWGREGVAGWGFNQVAYDCGIAINPGIWIGPYFHSSVYGASKYMHTRYVFFEGFQYWGAGLEIAPADIATINIGLPFISNPRSMSGSAATNEAADQFKAAVFQLNLNLDFGTIAITYDGASRAGLKGIVSDDDGPQDLGLVDGGTIFASFDGTFGDLGLLVGLSYHLAGAENAEKPQWGANKKAPPIGVGLGVKYATDSFGVKFRLTAALAGDKEGPAADTTFVNASVLPYFPVGDSMTLFVHAGLGMMMGDAIKAQNGDKNITGWYFNPYVRVGGEWGPSFYAGIQASTDGTLDADEKTTINWAIPIALVVSF